MAPDDVAILMAKMMAMEATWKEHEKSAQERYTHNAEHLALVRKSQDLVLSKLEKMDDECSRRGIICSGMQNDIRVFKENKNWFRDKIGVLVISIISASLGVLITTFIKK